MLLGRGTGFGRDYFRSLSTASFFFAFLQNRSYLCLVLSYLLGFSEIRTTLGQDLPNRFGFSEIELSLTASFPTGFDFSNTTPLGQDLPNRWRISPKYVLLSTTISIDDARLHENRRPH